MSPRRNEPIIDALPEHYPYKDDGCDISPSCLRCPLPRCKYDDPVAYYRELREGRDQEVVRVRHIQGKTVPQLARRFGVSQRTIHRILSRARHVPGDTEGDNFL
ncbi:MAG: helix-turn-helix domain-containing protein [Chloroflexi bacterium]|nr:helix-turn-helix domain-containing protein [Chloroflexota bacterium]